MDAKARRALEQISALVQAGRYVLSPHFMDRMGERGFVWGDILAVLDSPTRVRADGLDDGGRARWFVAGNAVGRERVEMLIVVDDAAYFITIVWGHLRMRESS